MDEKEIQDMIRELDEISRELDRTQREITRDLVSRISSVQSMIQNSEPARELILEKTHARVILREGGQTVFEGLY